MKGQRHKIHLRINLNKKNNNHQNNRGTLVLPIGINKVNNNKAKIHNLEHLQILIFHNNHKFNHKDKCSNKIYKKQISSLINHHQMFNKAPL